MIVTCLAYGGGLFCLGVMGAPFMAPKIIVLSIIAFALTLRARRGATMR